MEFHYRWHPFYGGHFKHEGREDRASGAIVRVEIRPGEIIRVPEWILDRAFCANMEMGEPRVAVTALIELHRLLTERGFRQTPTDVGGIAETLDALAGRVAQADRDWPERLSRPEPADPATASVEAIFDAIDALAPRDAIYLNEATSTLDIGWKRLRMEQQGSYYFAAAGGLGFAMPAALGVQLASPDRPVVAIIGDGSANYSITSLWTAAKYDIPVIYVIINNGTYGALRGFATRLKAVDVPGLDVGGIDFVKVAEGYGVSASKVDTVADFRRALAAAFEARVPTLIDVLVAG